MRRLFNDAAQQVFFTLAMSLGCAIAAPSHAAGTAIVVIEGMAYHPERIEVRPGDTVVWINKDVVPHTVTEENRKFDSGEIGPGASWSMLVSGDGEGSYFCAYHPTMKGKIIIGK